MASLDDVRRIALASPGATVNDGNTFAVGATIEDGWGTRVPKGSRAR
jgi:hypothetical protein